MNPAMNPARNHCRRPGTIIPTTGQDIRRGRTDLHSWGTITPNHFLLGEEGAHQTAEAMFMPKAQTPASGGTDCYPKKGANC